MIPITFKVQETQERIISKQLNCKQWISDFPIMAYQKSINEICIVNYMEAERTNNQVVISLAPYIFRCFVQTEVKCNETLYGRDYDKESHILLMVTDKDSSNFIMDLRIDSLNVMREKQIDLFNSTAGKTITCQNGHSIVFSGHKKEIRCKMCGENNGKEVKGLILTGTA